MDHSRLFDPADFPAILPAPQSDLSDLIAAAQEDDDVLIPAPDGQLARKVHIHSLDKAHIAKYYAAIVGTGMKNAFPDRLAWVELYCGPGKLFVKELGTFTDGSPLAALAIRDPFNTYVFADLDPLCVAALRARIGDSPGVHVLEGDANSADLHDKIAALVPRNALVVLYADPAELNFHFKTIEFFAERYKHLDLLLNFPVPGVVRALRAGHQAKVSQVINHDEPISLIGPTSGRPGVSLREYFERQLRGLGYGHFASELIRLHSKNTPIYDLMIASREAKAKEFFEEALKRGPGGQYRLPLF